MVNSEKQINGSDGEYSSSSQLESSPYGNLPNDIQPDASARLQADEEEQVQEFVGDEPEHELSRHSTFLARTQSKFSFFNEKLKDRRIALLKDFAQIYVIMGVCVLLFFSIYWGSLYDRLSRLHNLRMLVVIEDDQTIQGVQPYIGNTMREMLQTPQAKHLGDWHIYNSTEFGAMAEKHNNTIEAEVRRQVHHREYWSSIYVKANASHNFYQAIVDGNTQYNVSDNSIVSIYETGRDFLNMNNYVTSAIKLMEQSWLKLQNNVTSSIIGNLRNASDVFSSADSLRVLGTPLQFTYYDYRPFTDSVITAPAQVGLIYMIILTFFQFNFFSDVHQKVTKFGLKPLHFLIYRVGASIMSFFVLSLFFSLVSLAFQVDFGKAFGRSGFLVYWMVSFLTMWAVGLANEIAALILIVFYPPLIGFWMLFWVIINISSSFSPMALTSPFFRYGYALPIHNSYEITKVILFDTWKGELGRNFGILVAWVVILTLALPPTLLFFKNSMMKKAQAAAQAAAAEKAQEGN